MNKPVLKRRPGRPRAEEAELKRRSLIITALEEFARVGFHGASLRDIAENAEVSSRTLYNHFPDKLALFEACLEYSSRQIQPALPDFEGNLHERLVAYATAMQEELSIPQSQQITALIYREAGGFDDLRQIARIQFERYQVIPVARILENHGVSESESFELAKQFVAMALGEWQRRHFFGGEVMTKEQMEEQAKLATKIFLNGIISQ